jgi:hypothetical protein
VVTQQAGGEGKAEKERLPSPGRRLRKVSILAAVLGLGISVLSCLYLFMGGHMVSDLAVPILFAGSLVFLLGLVGIITSGGGVNMARESSQVALEREGCLARMSRWATASPHEQGDESVELGGEGILQTEDKSARDPRRRGHGCLPLRAMTLLGAVAGLIVGSYLCIMDCTGTHRFLVVSCESYCYLIGPALGAILGAAAWYLIAQAP